MRFNLTPSIEIETMQELDTALLDLASEGVDNDWIQTLRTRAEPHVLANALRNR